MAYLTGRSIGHYHIIEQLGRGGMAVVYRAYDTRNNREVALKFVRRDAIKADLAQASLERFSEESRILVELNHPNIVKIYETGEEEGAPFLVMEYISGGTLKQLMGRADRSIYPPGEAASIIAQIARALEYAHTHHIIHRDVKPSNIIIRGDGVPILTDFGIAHILEPDRKEPSSHIRVGMGTPGYMAPELASGQVIDSRVDIYSLGVVFYQLITGRKPFEADTPLAVVLKHINEPLPRPKKLVPNLPDSVEQVIFKALAKNPDDRYQNMGEFAVRLEKIVEDYPKLEIPAPTQQIVLPIPTSIPWKSTGEGVRSPLIPAPPRYFPQGYHAATPMPMDQIPFPVKRAPEVQPRKGRSGGWVALIVTEFVILFCLIAIGATLIGAFIFREVINPVSVRQDNTPSKLHTITLRYSIDLGITQTVLDSATPTYTLTPSLTKTPTALNTLVNTKTNTPKPTLTNSFTPPPEKPTSIPTKIGSDTAPSVGNRAPEFSLINVDGKTVSLSNYFGKPVILVFFATWCSHCQAEAPYLSNTYRQYHDQDLEILAVNVFIETGDDAGAFAKQFNWEFVPLLDSQAEITGLYHLKGVPTNFFIDRTGIIQQIVAGGIDQVQIDTLITKIIP